MFSATFFSAGEKLHLPLIVTMCTISLHIVVTICYFMHSTALSLANRDVAAGDMTLASCYLFPLIFLPYLFVNASLCTVFLPLWLKPFCCIATCKLLLLLLLKKYINDFDFHYYVLLAASFPFVLICNGIVVTLYKLHCFHPCVA